MNVNVTGMFVVLKTVAAVMSKNEPRIITEGREVRVGAKRQQMQHEGWSKATIRTMYGLSSMYRLSSREEPSARCFTPLTHRLTIIITPPLSRPLPRFAV